MGDPFTFLMNLHNLGQTALQVGQYLFSDKRGDIPVCHTRIQRVGWGLPWEDQIGVHPLENGKLQLTPITETPEQEFDTFTREDYLKALKKVSRKSKK